MLEPRGYHLNPFVFKKRRLPHILGHSHTIDERMSSWAEAQDDDDAAFYANIKPMADPPGYTKSRPHPQLSKTQVWMPSIPHRTETRWKKPALPTCSQHPRAVLNRQTRLLHKNPFALLDNQ